MSKINECNKCASKNMLPVNASIYIVQCKSCDNMQSDYKYMTGVKVK